TQSTPLPHGRGSETSIPGRAREQALGRYGLASVDLASGGIFVQELEGDTALRSELVRLSPSECLLPDECAAHELIPQGTALSRLKPAAFEAREAQSRIIARFAQFEKSATAAL